MRRPTGGYAPDDPTVCAAAPGSSVRLRTPGAMYDVVVGDWSVDALIGLRHRLVVIRHQLDEADRWVDAPPDAGARGVGASAPDALGGVFGP